MIFIFLTSFLVADKRLYKRLCPSVRPSVRPLVGWLVGRSVVIELESVKTRISAPAHPSATGIGHVSGLVHSFNLNNKNLLLIQVPPEKEAVAKDESEHQKENSSFGQIATVLLGNHRFGVS